MPAKAVGAPCRYVPSEKNMVSLPPYVIEPPDILLIDALRIIPKEPFQIQPLDVLQVEVEGTKLDQPISGLYLVEPGGMLNLGPGYGKVKVGGLSLEEATAAVTKQLEADAERSAGLADLERIGRPAADCRRAFGRARRHDQPGHLRPGVRGGADDPRSQRGHRRSTCTQYLESPLGVGRRVRLQQQGVLRDHRKGPALATTFSGSRSPATKRCWMPSARSRA